MESSRHNKRQKTSVSDSRTTKGNITGNTEAIDETIIPSDNEGLDTKATIEITERKAVSETKIPNHDQNDKSKHRSTQSDILFSFKNYNSRGDIHKKCGQLPDFIENVMFLEGDGFKNALNYNNLVDLNTLLLAARSIYHLNSECGTLHTRPIFIGEGNDLIQCVTKKAENIILPNELEVQYDTPMAFLIPESNTEHFVCAKICFRKPDVNNDATVEVEIFDSSYQPKDSKKIDTLDCDPDLTKDFLPYVPLKVKEYYSDFVQKKIMAQLWNTLETKSEEDSQVDESNGQAILSHSNYMTGEEAENVSLDDLNGKQYKSAGGLKFKISLKNSILIPSSTNDKTCGINSIVCLLLLMTGEDPSLCEMKFSKTIGNVPKYHKCMMLLFLLSIHKFINDIEDVEYVNTFDHTCGNDQNLMRVTSCDAHNAYFKIMKDELMSLEVDWKTALGDKLFGLFSFLEFL